MRIWSVPSPGSGLDCGPSPSPGSGPGLDPGSGPCTAKLFSDSGSCDPCHASAPSDDGAERNEAQHLDPGTHGHRRLSRSNQTHTTDLRLLPPPFPHLLGSRFTKPRLFTWAPQPQLGGLGDGRGSSPVPRADAWWAWRGRVSVSDRQRGHIGGHGQLRQRRLQ